jgi:L-iditol 2-dehydrogenase
MKGVMKVARGEGNVEVRDVPEPHAPPHHVVIQVAATGVCGTDIHIYHDEYPYNPPAILGHETAGTIVELGADCERIKIGDRVTTETFYYVCGQCRFCRSGQPNLCAVRKSIGSHVNGAMTKYVVVPEHNCHVLPANVDLIAASITEPLACCVHGVLERGGVLAGDIVLVSGPGAIGQFSHQVAKSAGATTIVVGINGDEHRLALAKELGADYVLNGMQEDLPKLVNELTDGRGVDVAIEASGANPSLIQCLNLVRKGGTVDQMGLYSRPATADMNLIPLKELKYSGSFSQVPSSWPRAIRLVSEGKVNSGRLVTRQVPLTDWQSAFEAFNARTECKIVVTPVD